MLIQETSAESKEIVVKEGDSLTYLTDLTLPQCVRQFRVERGAKLRLFCLGFSGSFSSQTVVELAGEGAEAETYFLFLGRAEDQQEWHSTHVHSAPHTKSQMVMKGAVKGASKAKVYGNIVMKPGVEGAEAHLAEHNLILSGDARVEAIPALEIAHHNVNAGHAATLERVNEEELFYLLSRGLSQEESLKLILEGFFWEVLEKSGESEWAEQQFEHLNELVNA